MQRRTNKFGWEFYFLNHSYVLVVTFCFGCYSIPLSVGMPFHCG